MTEAVTPLKMYEYLASGVPMVATPLPACVAEPAVSTASDAAGFAGAIDAALTLDREQRRELRRRAEGASWDRRIEPLLARLEGLGLRSLD
jgi:glycosyltransferase involved in cell wall biosynthesis